MKVIKKISMVLASCMLAIMFLVPAATVGAQDNSQAVCDGLALTGGQCGADDPTKTGVAKTIAVVINLLSLVVGVVAVIMIIIGGFKYIISGGDSNSISSAKNTILYAIIGLVIVALAQVIVKFVLNKVTGK